MSVGWWSSFAPVVVGVMGVGSGLAELLGCTCLGLAAPAPKSTLFRFKPT